MVRPKIKQLAHSQIVVPNVPNDYEVEKYVIGTILTYSEAFVYAGTPTEDSFHNENLKDVFRLIKKVVDNGDKPDMFAVYKLSKIEFNESKAQDLLIEMTTCQGSDFNGTYEQALKILEHYRQQRVWQELGGTLLYNSMNMMPQDLAKIHQQYMDLLVSATPAKTFDKDSIMDEILDIVQQNDNGTREIRRTFTGFRMIDEEGGFCTKKLILVGAGSSQGKSVMALTILRRAIMAGQNVAVYSMEMDRTSIGIRLLNEEGLGLKESSVMNERLYSSKMDVFRAAERIKGYKGNFFIDDTSKSSVEKIIESIRNLNRKHNIVGVIVDYVQILNVHSTSKDNAEKVLADCARLFQEEAKTSDVWIMLLSQISRNPQALTHEPSSDRLRGSGQLFEACDMNILIYRPEVYNERYPEPFADVDTKDTAMLKLVKNRGGRSHKAEIVHFYGERQLFEPFAEGESLPKSYFAPMSNQSTSTNTPF